MKFTTRAYNSFALNPKTKASIIKTSEEERLKGEAEYYLDLPDDLKVFFPRMINCDLTPPYTMELEYYAYNNLGNVMVSSEYDSDFWEKTFDFLLGYINTYKESESIPANCKDSLLMFVDKTEKEYVKLMYDFDFFRSLRLEDEFVLNDKPLKSFNKIWGKLKEFIKTKLIEDNFYYIHMIDPRGVFGKTKYFGDPYYDLAKISHSCNGGYEYFIYDQFQVDVESNKFFLDFKNEYNKDKINSKFIKLVDEFKFDYQKIKLIEGCIFIGMCARHYDSLERQKAMFITGLDILNQIYETL
jgi:hypothetical protein